MSPHATALQRIPWWTPALLAVGAWGLLTMPLHAEPGKATAKKAATAANAVLARSTPRQRFATKATDSAWADLPPRMTPPLRLTRHN